MGNLKEQGFRLMVNKDKNDVEWIHPLEIAALVGYTDCSDMTDDEFDAFIAA